MTLFKLDLIAALITEIQRQANGDCTVDETGMNALFQAADVVVLHQDAFEPIAEPATAMDTETMPLPLEAPAIPGWEAA